MHIKITALHIVERLRKVGEVGMNDNGTIRCYTCKHRHHIAGDYDPYCEANCGDAWQGYEADDEDGEPDGES